MWPREHKQRKLNDMLIHFFCFCPLGLTIKQKVAYSQRCPLTRELTEFVPWWEAINSTISGTPKLVGCPLFYGIKEHGRNSELVVWRGSTVFRQNLYYRVVQDRKTLHD